jgi:Skp family chaperone for outer membrane proteins
VKKTVVIVTGVAALTLVGYLGSRLAADPPKTPVAPAPQPKTKVAVLNLSKVIKGYRKWDDFQAKYKEKIDSYDKQLQPLKKELDDLQALGNKPGTDNATKEQIGKKMRLKSTEMQDKADEFKKQLADYEGTSFTTIYNDVKDMTARYARSKEIELVMHFNDGVTEPEANTPQNIGRKMGHGPCFPLYVVPGMDISDDVLKYLNAALANAPTSYSKPGSGSSN